MTKPPVFLGYARKSRIDAKHRNEVESTDRQVARLKAWAAEAGCELELFAEPDGHRSGGSILHRPAYQQMLERVRVARPGEIAGIVATELDRTGRRERDMHDLFDEVVTRGLRLIVLDDPTLNLESTDGRFMAGLKVLLAAQERRRAGDRVRGALHDRRNRGYHVGATPYGYRNVELESDAGHTIKTLEPDPIEAERLVAILEKYLTGVGIDGVARWCNGLGWRTRRGGTWTAVSINELLIHVMVYRGYVLTRDAAQRVVGMSVARHPPLISERLAQAVQAAKQQRAQLRRPGRKAMQPYPLVHLAWCAECGSHIVGATSNGDKRGPFEAPRLFYRCKKDLGPCTSSRLHALPLEHQVWAALFEFRDEMTLAASTVPDLVRFAEQALPEPSSAGALQAEMDRLNRMYLKGRISEEQYDRDYEALAGKLATTVMAAASAPDVLTPLGLETLEQQMTALEEAVATGDRGALVTLARTFVERVEVLHGEVVLVRLVPQLQQVRLLYQELRHPSVILNG